MNETYAQAARRPALDPGGASGAGGHRVLHPRARSGMAAVPRPGRSGLRSELHSRSRPRRPPRRRLPLPLSAMRTLRTVLVSAIVAGLIGGAIASAFHGFFTEPVIDRAIAAEEAARGRPARAPRRGARGEPPRPEDRARGGPSPLRRRSGASSWGSRSTRREGGRPARGASRAAGRSWPASSAGRWRSFPSSSTRRIRPVSASRIRSDTGRRSTSASWRCPCSASPWRRRIRRRTGGWLAPAVFYAVWALGIYFLMPPNPDPVELSETIVRPFRALSLAGLVIFWSALSAVLAVLGHDRAAARSLGPRTASPAGNISSRASTDFDREAPPARRRGFSASRTPRGECPHRRSAPDPATLADSAVAGRAGGWPLSWAGRRATSSGWRRASPPSRHPAAGA